MRKITLSVAFLLLGGGYIANAQVGIGTPTPKTSTMLDIESDSKGVLIPRVLLTETTEFAPITGDKEESLLVYNTNTNGDAAAVTAGTNVVPGYYYWANGKWNRVMSQTDLTALSGPKTGDVIYQEITAGSGDLVFQYWDGTKYETISFDDIIKANESKTLLMTSTDGTTQYYISETYLKDNPAPTQAEVDDWADGTTTVTAGVYKIEVVDGVVNNIETILKEETTIEKPGTTNEYYTVEEYIQYVSSMADGNVIYKNIGDATNPNWVFQYWDATADNGNGEYKTITIDSLVKANESKTLMMTSADGTTQYYISETYLNTKAAPTQAIVNAWADGTTAVPAGVYKIEVVDGVVNNIETILKEETTILKPGTTTNEYFTVEEYIQYVSSMADGNVIYKNLGTTAAPNWVFQYWDAAADNGNGKYVNITIDSLVKANESKTVIVSSDDSKYQYFISEEYLHANNNTLPTQAVINGWKDTPVAHAYLIDVVGGVVNNIQTILSGDTNIDNTTGGTYTVEEYLQSIIKTQLVNGQTKIVFDATSGDVIFQIWDEAGNDWSDVDNLKFNTIVTDNETKTTILRSETQTDGTLGAYEAVDAPTAANLKKGEIIYQYNAEEDVNYINLTQDIISSITNNKELNDLITNILNGGGNVYYTDTKIDAVDNDGTEIPAKSLFTIDTAGNKTPIDISGAVLNTITVNKDAIKVILGDDLFTSNTYKTGDIWINGKEVYGYVGETTISANSAKASQMTIAVPTGLGDISAITSITLYQGSNIVTSAVTDVVVSGATLNFNIGTGNMYNILPAATYKVVVEYTGTTK